jgi:hypothetical protein
MIAYVFLRVWLLYPTTKQFRLGVNIDKPTILIAHPRVDTANKINVFEGWLS